LLLPKEIDQTLVIGLREGKLNTQQEIEKHLLLLKNNDLTNFNTKLNQLVNSGN
jgi:hypothetical protein